MNIDITLCSGTGCPLKDTCKRYKTGLKAVELKLFPLWWMEPDYNNGNCKYLRKSSSTAASCGGSGCRWIPVHSYTGIMQKL